MQVKTGQGWDEMMLYAEAIKRFCVCGEKWNMNSTYIHRRVRRYIGTHMLICIYCTINHTVKLSLISLNSQTEEEKDSISFHILFCQMEVCRAPHTQPNGHKFSIFLPLEHSAHSLIASSAMSASNRPIWVYTERGGTEGSNKNLPCKEGSLKTGMILGSTDLHWHFVAV